MANGNKTNIVLDEYVGTSYGEASGDELRHLFNYVAAAQMPLMIVGDPGVGKTALINAWSRENGYGEPINLIGSQMEPQDVAGLPHSEYDELLGIHYTEYLIPVWQKQLFDGNKHVLFFDEFSNTPRSVQAGLLKIIGEGRFANGQLIPEGTVIIGAMNPENSAVDYTPIASPMANRLMFVSYRPTDNEVYEGMVGGWFTDEEKDAWSENEIAWRELVVDFLKKEPQLILALNDLANNQFDSSKEAYLDPDSEKSESEREILVTAWASPRSWDNACRVLASSKLINEITPIQERILAGMVGRKATARLVDFAHRRSKVDGFKLILDPSSFNWKVASAKGNTANDVQEAVSAVIAKIPRCDGQAGRPGPVDVLDFFEKAIDLGAGPHLATYFCQPGETRTWINEARPSDIAPKDWTSRICDILIKFKEGEYIS